MLASHGTRPAFTKGSYSDGCGSQFGCLHDTFRRQTYGFHHGWQLETVSDCTTMRQTAASRLTENLLQLHDARVGPDVVDALGLLGLDVIIFKDIGERQGLLGRGHCDGSKTKGEVSSARTDELAELRPASSILQLLGAVVSTDDSNRSN